MAKTIENPYETPRHMANFLLFECKYSSRRKFVLDYLAHALTVSANAKQPEQAKFWKATREHVLMIFEELDKKKVSE